MQELQHTDLLSLHALDHHTRQALTAAIIPSAVVYSSDYLAWGNLLLNVYRHRPLTQIAVPPIAEDGIVLNLRGAARLSGNIAQRFQTEAWETGNLVIIPKGEPSQLHWSAPNDVLVLLPAPTLLGSLVEEVSERDPSQVAIVPCINGHDPLFYQLGMALLTELQTNTPPNDLYVESLTRMVGLHLLRHYTTRPVAVPIGTGVLAPATLRRVLDYIHAHLTEPLSVRQLAQEAHLSPYHFTRLFKRTVGRPLHQFVVERRLEAAKQLLLTSQLSIGAVAVSTGFSDQSHLHRHFRRHYGITPGSVVAQRKNHH